MPLVRWKRPFRWIPRHMSQLPEQHARSQPSMVSTRLRSTCHALSFAKSQHT